MFLNEAQYRKSQRMKMYIKLLYSFLAFFWRDGTYYFRAFLLYYIHILFYPQKKYILEGVKWEKNSGAD